MVDGRDSVHTAHAPKPAGEVLRRGQGRVQTPPLSGEETTVPDQLLSPRPVTLMPVQVSIIWRGVGGGGQGIDHMTKTLNFFHF